MTTVIERLEKLAERIRDQPDDAEVMVVSIPDMRQLLYAAERGAVSGDAQEQLDRVREQLSALQRSNARLQRLIDEASVAQAKMLTSCATCEARRVREFELLDQLRFANIRLEGAGHGAVELTRGAAKLVNSFLPAGSKASEIEVASRLGVIMPGALAKPAVERKSMYDEAVANLTPLPEGKEDE